MPSARGSAAKKAGSSSGVAEVAKMDLGKGTAVARKATAEPKQLPSARGSATKKASSWSSAAEVTKTEAAKGTALARRAAAERVVAMKAAAEQAMREAEAEAEAAAERAAAMKAAAAQAMREAEAEAEVAEREALEAEALAMTVEATWTAQQGAAVVEDGEVEVNEAMGEWLAASEPPDAWVQQARKREAKTVADAAIE